MDRWEVNQNLRSNNTLWKQHACALLTQWCDCTRLPFPILAAHAIYSGVEINEYGQPVVFPQAEKRKHEQKSTINNFLNQYGTFHLVSVFGLPSSSSSSSKRTRSASEASSTQSQRCGDVASPRSSRRSRSSSSSSSRGRSTTNDVDEAGDLLLGQSLLRCEGGLFLRRDGSYDPQVFGEEGAASRFGRSTNLPRVRTSHCAQRSEILTANAPPKLSIHPPFVSFSNDLSPSLYPPHIFREKEESGAPAVLQTTQEPKQEEAETRSTFRFPSHCTTSVVWSQENEQDTRRRRRLCGAFSMLNGDVILTRGNDGDEDDSPASEHCSSWDSVSLFRSGGGMKPFAAVRDVSAMCVWSSLEEECSNLTAATTSDSPRPMWIVGRSNSSFSSSPWWEAPHTIISTTTDTFLDATNNTTPSSCLPRFVFSQLLAKTTGRQCTIFPRASSALRDPSLRYAVACVDRNTAVAYLPDKFLTTPNVPQSSPALEALLAPANDAGMRFLDSRCLDAKMVLNSSSRGLATATRPYTCNQTPLLCSFKSDPNYLLFSGTATASAKVASHGVGLVDLRKADQLVHFTPLIPTTLSPITHMTPIYVASSSSPFSSFMFATAQGAQVAIWSLPLSKSSASASLQPQFVYSGHVADITVMQVVEHCGRNESVVDRRQTEDGKEEDEDDDERRNEYRATLLTAALDNTLHLWQTTPLI